MTDMERRFLLVGNPTSGSGKAAAYIDEALDAMRQRIWYVDFVHTLPEGKTVDVVRERLQEHSYDTVIALGGDGTFAEVAKALLASGTDTMLAFLPFGTANDQGKSFGIRVGPGSLSHNLDVIERGAMRRIDVGLVRRLDGGVVTDVEHVFHSVGWGMQPDILAVRNAERQAVEEHPILRSLYRDYAVYAGAAADRYIASWVEPTKFDAHILADGEPIELLALTDLVVNATSVYGGIFVLDRFAEPDDGLFEMLPIHGRRDWALSAMRTLRPIVVLEKQMGILPRAREGMRQVSHLDVRFERPGKELIRSQIDGEQWLDGNHFQLEVFRKALPLCVPYGYVPPWKE